MTETRFNCYDCRNGLTWTISRMIDGTLHEWLKIRPVSMYWDNPPQGEKTTTIKVSEPDGTLIYVGTHSEGEDIQIPAINAVIVLSDMDTNQGTLDMECCITILGNCNMNVSIYDEEEQGVENASVMYAGETIKTNSSGFVSFLVPCNTISDVLVDLPTGYSKAGESHLIFEDTPSDADDDPTTPHILYIQVDHTPPSPKGVTLNVPSVVMAGEVEITGTCDIAGLKVNIYAVKKYIGFDWMAADTLIATAITGLDHQFKTTVKFEEFGILELYAKVSDDLKSSKHTVFVLTPTVAVAMILAIGLILEKKYNKLGIFKR